MRRGKQKQIESNGMHSMAQFTIAHPHKNHIKYSGIRSAMPRSIIKILRVRKKSETRWQYTMPYTHWRIPTLCTVQLRIYSLSITRIFPYWPILYDTLQYHFVFATRSPNFCHSNICLFFSAHNLVRIYYFLLFLHFNFATWWTEANN